MDDEIAGTSLAIESVHPFTTECDQCSMLCSCLDFDFFFTEYREIQRPLYTECCLSWRYMHNIVEIGSITSESTLTIWNRECDIEITATVGSLVSLTSDFDRHTIFDALGYIDGL
jgi:hypothetical protein